MAESFVRTMMREHVSWMPSLTPGRRSKNLAITFDDSNESHPHSALKYRSPREFRQRGNSLT
jgi:putative transposase